MNNPNKARRIAFMISGGVDALIGAALLLIGFGFLPIDVAQYGFQNWLVNLLGGVMFLLGAITFAYNFSRLEE
jgi:ABC-type branched-subunit amino acid transport system permease subunit